MYYVCRSASGSQIDLTLLKELDCISTTRRPINLCSCGAPADEFALSGGVSGVLLSENSCLNRGITRARLAECFVVCVLCL